MRKYVLIAVVCLSTASPIAAQETGSCADAVAAFGNGGDLSPRGRWGVMMMGGCPEGPAQLAWGLRAQRQSRDTTIVLRDLFLAATLWRDADLLSAASEIAVDQGASPEARMTALKLLFAVHTRLAFIWPSTDGRMARQECTPRGGTDVDAATATPLPANYLGRIVAVGRAVAGQSGTPDHVRRAGDCLARITRALYPPTVDASAIALTATCGTSFRIDNRNEQAIRLTYHVSGTTERTTVTVPAQQSIGIETIRRGTVQLFHDGRPIRMVAPSSAPCR